MTTTDYDIDAGQITENWPVVQDYHQPTRPAAVVEVIGVVLFLLLALAWWLT